MPCHIAGYGSQCETAALIRMGNKNLEATCYCNPGCFHHTFVSLRFKGSLNTTKCEEDPMIHTTKEWQRWWKGFYTKNRETWAADNVMLQFAKRGGPGNCSFVNSTDWIARDFCPLYLVNLPAGVNLAVGKLTYWI